MQSYHVEYGAGLAGLTVRDHPIPRPGAGEVLVRIRANSLNRRELSILRGQYPLPVKPDVVAVSDGAGEVVATGAGVDRVRLGDRVVGVVFPRWVDGPFGLEVADQLGGSLDGMLTEYAVLGQDAVLRFPDHLTYEEAATLPCAAVTAWNALTGGRGLRAGETVLTLGSGGVSLFAIQFAALLGARVIATTGRAANAERLTALGAEQVIDYLTTPDWFEQVRKLTDGRGVDQVIDVAGTLEQSLRSAAMAGEVAFVGTLAGAPPVDPRLIFTAGAVLRPIALGSRAHFVAMNEVIAAHRARPVIDRVFPFEQAASAYRYYQDARPFGKVVITQSAAA